MKPGKKGKNPDPGELKKTKASAPRPAPAGCRSRPGSGTAGGWGGEPPAPRRLPLALPPAHLHTAFYERPCGGAEGRRRRWRVCGGAPEVSRISPRVPRITTSDRTVGLSPAQVP